MLCHVITPFRIRGFLQLYVISKTNTRLLKGQKAVAHFGVTAFLIFKNLNNQVVGYIPVPLGKTIFQNCLVKLSVTGSGAIPTGTVPFPAPCFQCGLQPQSLWEA